jgi:hypothetical protein
VCALHEITRNSTNAWKELGSVCAFEKARGVALMKRLVKSMAEAGVAGRTVLRRSNRSCEGARKEGNGE